MKTKEILTLQNSTIEKIYKPNKWKTKTYSISTARSKISENRKTVSDSLIINKIKKLGNELLNQVCSEIPNDFWERKNILFTFDMKRISMRKKIQLKLDPYK